MTIELDVQIICEPKVTANVLLSIGYGSGHMVAQIDGSKTLDRILAFIEQHRAERKTNWVNIGNFGPCPVTLVLSSDSVAIVVDSGVTVHGFGQSAGLYIPTGLLDKLVAALKHERSKLGYGSSN